MKKTQVKQRGIGLLELMLAMVIIAIVTLLSIQYFSSSKRNTATSKAVNEIQSIVTAVAGMPYPVVDSFTSLTDDVAMSGKISSEYVYYNGKHYKIMTPWQPAGSHEPLSQFQVVIEDTRNSPGHTSVLRIESAGTGDPAMPNWGCQAIVDKYKAVASYASCKGRNPGGLVLEFSLQQTDNL